MHSFKNNIKTEKAARLFLVMVISIMLLCGCKGMELENKTEQVEGYTRSQAMIILANERNHYQNVYGPGIWDIRVSDDGSTFDRLLAQNVKQYMEQLKLICMLADERGVEVNSSERDIVRQMTDAYMSGLSEADLAYIGCTREDVQKLYTDLLTADKLVRTVTAGVYSELSDSEVKVIRIQQIGTADLRKAKGILKKIKIDGSDFSSMASRYSELEQIELELSRGNDSNLIERTAFRLDEGKVSNILAVGDMYYIIKVSNGYDAEATRERKNRLQTALDSDAFQTVLTPYKAVHNIRFLEHFWNELDLKRGKDSTVENFYEIFERFTEE